MKRQNCRNRCDLATAAISLCSTGLLLFFGGTPFMSMCAYCCKSFISKMHNERGMKTQLRIPGSSARSDDIVGF